jgi:hypothetical protein
VAPRSHEIEANMHLPRLVALFDSASIVTPFGMPGKVRP